MAPLLHGHNRRGARTPTYSAWASMVRRCRNPHTSDWPHYGGRGITVCERWTVPGGIGFVNFLEDMGERPTGKTLDRINNDGNYEPANCRWATDLEQASNRRPRRPTPLNKRDPATGRFVTRSHERTE